jgi:6-phosphogluconolactonase
MIQRLAQFGAAFLWLAVAVLLLPGHGAAEPAHASSRFVYVGTYTAPAVPPGGSEPSVAEGIYVFRMDTRSGALTPVQLVAASNPSYLALDRSLSHLYSVNEDGDGHLSAYAIDREQGTLSPLNSVPSAGEAPTYLSVHPSGQYLMAANYSTGNYPIVRIEPDGSLGATTAVFQSVGNGIGATPIGRKLHTRIRSSRIPRPSTCSQSIWAATRSTC